MPAKRFVSVPDCCRDGRVEEEKTLSSSRYNISQCPNCGWPKIAVRVTSWADFHDGEPDCFDDEDIGYVEPIAGAEAFCRRCNHNWVIVDRTTIEEIGSRFRPANDGFQ